MTGLPSSTGRLTSSSSVSCGSQGYLKATPLSCSRHTSSRTLNRPRICTVEARFRGRNTDLTRVPQFMRHETDTGSPEVQISLLSARVKQLSKHLQANRKDYASRRGLDQILSKRRHFLQFLYDNNRQMYERLIHQLEIRPLRIQAGRNVVVRATEEGLVVETDSTTAGDVASEETSQAEGSK